MVLKTDQERIKALLKDTITLLCRNGLTFKTEFSIEALIGITLDQDDVLLVNINEIVRTELGNKLAAAAQESGQSAHLGGSDDWDENYSDEGSQHSPSHSSSGRKRKRKRRRSTGNGSRADEESDGGESGDSITGADDANSLSEPPMKRPQPAATSRVKNSVKQENEDEDDDDSKDIVFIKEEVDSGDWAGASSSQGHQDGFTSDLSGIPSNASMNQQQENFDFLHGNSLIPMTGTSQQNANLWSEMTGRQNITSPASKRTSTITSNTTGAPGMGDESQQMQYVHSKLYGDMTVSAGLTGQATTAGYENMCTICEKKFSSKNGYRMHMNKHKGVHDYMCSVCQRGFMMKINLENHMRTHTGDRLACQECSATFLSAQGLQRHIKFGGCLKKRAWTQ